MWCICKIDAEYRRRMYDILNLYMETYNPKKPVIGFDEKSKQLLREKRKPIPMKKGSLERYDYEYVRNNTANIFVAIDFKAGKRVTQVTDHRTKTDFALFMKHLVDDCYPNADVIRVIADNLNTHFESSFYDTFEVQEAERILSKIEFHYTPTHASWLNVAEIEINVMDAECTGRRIGDKETLTQQVAYWTERRNSQMKTINWKFTKDDADKKLSKHYV